MGFARCDWKQDVGSKAKWLTAFTVRATAQIWPRFISASVREEIIYEFKSSPESILLSRTISILLESYRLISLSSDRKAIINPFCQKICTCVEVLLAILEEMRARNEANRLVL